MANAKYREYFDIDEQYFPQINDSSIKDDPELWKRTYPHSTFIEMLSGLERVLSRKEKRSLWVEGVYGTGKSQCAYAMKKILDAPKEDVQAYWDRYEPLRKEVDLLGKINGHKDRGIVTAYRYASGGINSPRDLFFAIQETLKTELVNARLYAGEDALKDSVIAWIDDPINKTYFDALLKEPKYASMFTQSNADEVLNALRKGGEIKSLMDNIFRLADERRISALNIDADRLIAWITDVIERNDIKIVFIWDEFSDYFSRNKESLSEFQKIAELVNLVPFYFVVVTHQSEQLFVTADTTWTKIRDRFIPVQITLPDNIAFDLIGHAFNIKQGAKSDWEVIAEDFNEQRLVEVRKRVMAVAKVSDAKVIRNMIPIQPMAALLLKNIASAFKSNQRSMFDFIKSANTEERSFQWFVENYGPYDDHPLLTVDLLWNFFYEKGRDNLKPDIRLILDTFTTYKQQLRDSDQEAVLKAVLILQAVDQMTRGQIDLFKATEQNLGYAFAGIPDLENYAAGKVAKNLKDMGILVAIPLPNNQFAYAAAVLAGDQGKIDRYKEDIVKNSSTAKLVAEGNLANVLPLTPALRLRFETDAGTGRITPITFADYKRTINILSEKPLGWKFHAVIAFAKNEEEQAAFRNELKKAAADKQYVNIVFIDALSTPLTPEKFSEYVEYSAMSMYYQGSQNKTSKEKADDAKRILDQDWKNRIYNGSFVVYTYDNPAGEKAANGHGVISILQDIVVKKFNMIGYFDFAKNVNENQVKLTAGKASALSGITGVIKGVVGGLDKYILTTLQPSPWITERYWENQDTAMLPISKLKQEVDSLIQSAFSRDGRISIADICSQMEEKGFAPSNLTAFVIGFLLKEYGTPDFRYIDERGSHQPMMQDKLAEMIGNCVGKPNAKPTHIVKMRPEEMAFYELSEKAWGLSPGSCSSPAQTASAVQRKMKELGLPVWCLEHVDNFGVFDIVQKYIELVQEEGSRQFDKSGEIGKIALSKPALGNSLSSLLTAQNCKNGMDEFLLFFEDGKVIELAKAVGADTTVISEIKKLFDGKHSPLWDKQIGEDEIKKLIVRYSLIRISNDVLDGDARSLDEAYKHWREMLRFIGISHEALLARFPNYGNLWTWLRKVSTQQDILPDQLSQFLLELERHSAEIRNILGDINEIFDSVYKAHLEGISERDIAEIKGQVGAGLFDLESTMCNKKVKEAAEEFRKKQLKTQLLTLWREKTGTKNPLEWSKHYKTPILSCVPVCEYEKAKKVFEALNRNYGTDSEIRAALEWLQTTGLFDVLADPKQHDLAFRRDLLGEYSLMLKDIDKVRTLLEEHLSVDIYNWRDDPTVKARIKQLAEAEYTSGGSDRVLAKIDQMDDLTQLKQYLKQLAKESIKFGMEILAEEGDGYV